MLDFHSHLPSKDSICCTDQPIAPKEESLLDCEGLLPDKWTKSNHAMLITDLRKNPNLQLGEVGLDRRFTDSLPLDRQMEILKDLLSVAIENGRCISLHCVRATEPMLDILETLDFRPYSILWHGFTGSKETAKQLSRRNVILSIGPRFKGSLYDLYNANHCIVPETDYTGNDADEHERILRTQYKRFEEDLKLDQSQLEAHTKRMLKLFRN